MKLGLVSDVHGRHGKLGEILEKEDFDAVLVGGDLGDASEFDYRENLEKVLDTLENSSGLTRAVPGNMDREEACVRALRSRRMNLHRNIASMQGFEAVGYGGGITPFGTEFEPSGEEIASSVRKLYERMSSDKRVAVIHQPPKNTGTDVADGEHVGSIEVRNALEDLELDLVLTGHIHESRGLDRLGKTRVVNPGPVSEGNYAVARPENGFEVELKSL